MFSIIDEFGDRLAYGECTKRGFRALKWFAKRYRPTALTRLHHPEGREFGSGPTVASAMVGGAIAGPAGVVIGSMLGASNKKVLFRIDTAEGESFLCRCGSWEWPSVNRKVTREVARTAAWAARATRR
jgi:hypothetical protein